MNGYPRIRALLPGRTLLPSPTRAGQAPEVFTDFGRTLVRLERAASTRRPRPDGEGA
ncbi:hypothetical protein [Bosea sp. 117]|uniref:hypothetical protein n=1 Tax=Bosea sp. 117 TaxID=1125973 RepID=UPI000ADFB8B9|nr:hypothetical protein [Bosea sp. 117]